MNDSKQFDTDVLVIGTGPAGATTALALATYGVRVRVITMYNYLANSPRAHITNQRAMEAMRDLGVEDVIRKLATPWEQMGDTIIATSLVGEEIARMRTWGSGDARKGDYIKGSPCPMADIVQPMMEPVLVQHAAERGAQFSFNTEYMSHIQDEEGVTVNLKDVLNGREYSVRARYLVGADGARSKVAEQIGLPIEGEMSRAGTAYVIFNADLSRYVAHRPSVLQWIANPVAGFGEIGLGLLRAVRPWNQWIAGWGFDMSQGEPDFSSDHVLQRIRTLVGDPDLEVEIEKNSTWHVNQAYATHYSKGRVHCAGDAVHRHPPSSGLGSNTSLQDGFNLAWKLAYVVKGYAGEALLDSYSLERQPVGKQIVLRANQSRVDYAPFKECFRMNQGVDTIEQLLERMRAPTPEGVEIRQLLQKALELKDYEFNAQGVELNQRYESNAVVVDGSAGEEVWSQDKQLFLQATTRPGAKIPHAWLVDKNGLRTSTLDVTGKGKFSLVTGLAGQAWVRAARELNLPYLRTVVTGEPGTADPYLDWQRIREIHEAGAVLVRPDGYIAWRQTEAVWNESDALNQLRSALEGILDRNI
ncbi:2,4-dichlorophenol 6-monooxygenase [Pseudomonas helleri]|uniref:2,4-dichlorophenol 6-monooxygenase n=1 Tax=Pseudomonas helleri TaxID=1608996 RepID=A0A7X1W6R3_9PSED|nr:MULTISPECIES: FAD-dependent monooxygenase [Pseudomonas]MQT46161.1 2,4-dichlorophenol 6-monooxygenase [Pseudomonas helleri]MQT57297.1 2,4-dichlorophenol 6-monooxygenase [Pseudomonas sp. FSL R10-0399]MQT88245.1 2,4-dichlorophenol 6-monooxygenase [Pseudomonas helleri]